LVMPTCLISLVQFLLMIQALDNTLNQFPHPHLGVEDTLPPHRFVHDSGTLHSTEPFALPTTTTSSSTELHKYVLL